MARSLEISKSQIEFDDKGLEKETKKSNFEITVTVDDQKNNGSFTVSSVLGDWFTYTIERFEDSSNGYVKIIIKVSKNLSTEDRHGLIKIEHNCANIIKYIEIVQDGVKYSLTSEYTNGWQFKSIPDELYEEKIVELKATNGRGRWYVKEVQQYQVTKGDSFGDATIEYKGLETQDELMRQTRVPYDGVFNYRIERGIDTKPDKLIVRSFGQIDLITKQNEINGHPHMRYFFVLSHCDVNNLNKTALEEKDIKFSDRKLFIFDGDDGNGSEYGEGDKPTVEPLESDSYIFTVNGSKSPLLNMTVEGGTSSPIVISTKNGSNLSYTASLSSSNDWCTINETGTTITINKNETSYRECVIIYTQSETNEVIKLKAVQDTATENFVFTVNSYTSNFTVPTISVSGSTYSTTVVSKKGNTEIPYSVNQKNSVDWAKYNDGVITVEKNTTTEERQVVYVFKQEGGSQKQPIYVTIVQSAASETWVFEVSPNSKVVSSNGETVNLTIKSLHNGEFIAFSAQDISEDWLYYDSSSESIVATSYPYSENGSSRSATITFVQSESNDKKTVTISQNKQEAKSAILVFVNDDNSETTAKTIEFEEYSSTVTVKVKSMDDEELPDSEIVITELPDWITSTSFANEGDGYYTTNITCATNNSSERTEEIMFTNSSGKSIVLTVKQAVNITYVYELDDNKLTVGWQGKYYEEPFTKVYSYSVIGNTKTTVGIKEVNLKDGDFITDMKFSGPYNDDPNGPYYKVTVEVNTNESSSPRTGHIVIVNDRNESLEVEVEQIKNGEQILTKFDYIVMNYEWEDYIDDDGVHSRDFDCVMYFDTASIGDMYRKTAYFNGKKIDENEVTYGELAYDQITSTESNFSRIETQVVYLQKLKDDGYLQKIKDNNDRFLDIALYGNLFKVDEAKKTPDALRQVKLSIHTYLGGTMERDDTNKTMINNDGTEVNVGEIQPITYHINAMNSEGGRTYDAVKNNFDYLGTIHYNVKNQSAVFSPNTSLKI